MAPKRKNQSGKRIAKRADPSDRRKPAAKPKISAPESSGGGIRERPQEKDSGFGVLKVVGGGIVVLIIVSVILVKGLGQEVSSRGDKMPGELCESTNECERGSICYDYKGEKKRCYVTCSTEKGCEPGYTCTSSTSGRRKSARLRAVCVENAKL